MTPCCGNHTASARQKLASEYSLNRVTCMVNNIARGLGFRTGPDQQLYARPMGTSFMPEPSGVLETLQAFVRTASKTQARRGVKDVEMRPWPSHEHP